MKDKNGIHLIEAIKNITDEKVLNDIIKTAENRLTELITKVNEDQKERIIKLLKNANKVHEYADDVDSNKFVEWFEECHTVFPCRGEKRDFKDCIQWLDEDLEEGSIDETEYHEFLDVIEKNAKQGYKAFIWDW